MGSAVAHTSCFLKNFVISENNSRTKSLTVLYLGKTQWEIFMDITVINAVISGCFSLAGALIGEEIKVANHRIADLEEREVK